MGDDISIDPNVVCARVTSLFKHFSKHPELYGNAASLQVVHGKRTDTPPGEEFYVVSLQVWLFGYEFPDTICLLSGDTFYVHASAKKLEYLKSAETASANAPVKIKLLPREKGDNTVPMNRAALDTLIASIVTQGSKVATFPSDPMEGAIAQGWVAEIAKAGITSEDGTKGLEGYFSVKDDAALADAKKAGVLTARVLKYVLVPSMESVIDEDKSTTNAAFSASSMVAVEDKASLEAKKVPVDTDNFEAVLPAVVQSGGEYDLQLLRPGFTSSTKSFSYDVIIMSLAMRYKTMRATIARTFLIDPTESMQRMYDVVAKAHKSMIDKLKPGTVIKDAVLAVRDEMLATEGGMPMSAKLVKNFGCGVGMRLSDRHLVLTHKNTTVVEPGMVFSVVMGLSDIPLEDKHPAADAVINKLSTYAIVLADTVMVTSSGPIVLTEKATSDRKQVSYEMAGAAESDEDEEEEEEDGKANVGAGGGREKRSSRAAVHIDANTGRDATGRSARLREKARDVDPDAARKREEHQLELLRLRQEEVAHGGRRKGGAGGDDDDIENAPPIAGYKSTSDFPKGTRPNQIIVDKSRDCILLPVLGTLIPFHISTIKNVSKSDEGQKAFLRFNFYSPGAALGKDASPSMQAAVMKQHNIGVFFRTLNFMSKDHRNFMDVDQKVKAMLKAHRTQRKEEKETAGLVEQARIIQRKDGVVPKMVDINMWPAISGRSTQGVLSAQVNGLLFHSNKGERVEIIYGNIKTAVFQPCEGEHVVLIHFHLKHPILIGKKKYREVQFFTEVVERVVAVDGRGRSDYDPDELNEEERERQLRIKLNKAFKIFVQKVEDSAAMDNASSFRSFEIPPRDLAFTGAWAKEMTTVLLGSNAIVAVVDKPPLVVPVEDIELVHFERVIHGGKSFDMVVVYRAGVVDKGQEEFVRISSIEMKHLETLKTWLDEVAEVIYTESAEALLWKPIIAEQVRNPSFWTTEYEDGGAKHPGMFEVLQPYEDEEGGAGAGGEDDEDSEEQSTEYSDEESESDDDDSDDESDDFADLVSEDDDDDDDDDDEDEVDDWDELERKAEAADKKRSRYEDEEDDEDDRRQKGGKKGGESKKGRR